MWRDSARRRQTYLFQPVVDILGGFVVMLSAEVPDGEGTKDESKSSNGADPDVDEARSKVISNGTQRAPAFSVGAKRLRLGLVVTVQALQWAEASKGARVQQTLLGVGVFHRGG